MAVTFNWKITPHANKQVVIDGKVLPEAIKVLDWQLIGTDGSQTASRSGVQILQWPDPDTFLSLASVTPEIMFSWLTNSIGPEKIQQTQEEIITELSSFLVEVPDARLVELESVTIPTTGTGS